MSDAEGPATRRERFLDRAEAKRVPLRAILAVDAVAVGTYVALKLVVHLKTVLLLLVVAAFLAVILDPAVVLLQRRGLRRGPAVGIVFVLGFLVFGGLTTAFGYPLVNAIAHFTTRLQSLTQQAEHGKGWLGHLVRRYHLQQKVNEYAPKLSQAAQKLAKPALNLGKAAVTAVGELVTIVMLTLFMLLEGARMRRGFLALLPAERALTVVRVSGEVSRSVTRYMAGRLLMAVLVALVSLVDLVATGTPFAVLLAIWALVVDLLPLVGGALIFFIVVPVALLHSVTGGIVTAAVLLVWIWVVENHVLNPVIMSRSVHINPLVVLVAVLMGASLGAAVASIFGGLVGALFAIPVASALHVIVREVWHRTDPTVQEGAAPASD